MADCDFPVIEADIETLAQHLGISPAEVPKLEAAGMPGRKLGPDGCRYDLVLTVYWHRGLGLVGAGADLFEPSELVLFGYLSALALWYQPPPQWWTASARDLVRRCGVPSDSGVRLVDRFRRLLAVFEQNYRDGFIAGAQAERERISAVVGGDESRGREGMALHLALHHLLEPREAQEILSRAPRDLSGSPSHSFTRIH